MIIAPLHENQSFEMIFEELLLLKILSIFESCVRVDSLPQWLKN